MHRYDAPSKQAGPAGVARSRQRTAGGRSAARFSTVAITACAFLAPLAATTSPVHADGVLRTGPDRVEARPASPGNDWIGSITLYGGLSKTTDGIAASGGGGWRLSLTADRGTVNPSLEVGRYGLGSRDVACAAGDPLHYDESLFHIGPAVSVRLAKGTVRPYLVAGVGFYRWTSYAEPFISSRHFDPESPSPNNVAWNEDYDPVVRHSMLGGSVGAGVQVHVAGSLSLNAEGRWHTNLTSGPYVSAEEPSRRLSLLSIMGGATLSW